MFSCTYYYKIVYVHKTTVNILTDFCLYLRITSATAFLFKFGKNSRPQSSQRPYETMQPPAQLCRAPGLLLRTHDINRRIHGCTMCMLHVALCACCSHTAAAVRVGGGRQPGFMKLYLSPDMYNTRACHDCVCQCAAIGTKQVNLIACLGNKEHLGPLHYAPTNVVL